MESQTATFPLPTPSSNQTRITILGAGIVGSALAFYLSARSPASQIILLDPSPASHAGSTAIAPGLVGQLNTIPHLTAIAKESVEAYLKVPRAFQKVGGLEIASSKEGIQELKKRREVAMESGLEAEILSSKEVSELAPDFHAEDEESIGLYFAGDGTADPPLIVRHYQDQVKAHGASIVATKVSAIVVGKDGKLSLATDHGALETDELIVAAGIWTAFLLQTLGINLPIVPVAHPYAYGPVRPRREKQQPFVRWPERHVYASDHGDCDGFGTYDHEPVPCVPGENALFEQGLDP
jgi:glycine/D-amino acid oxidase-like deaminating enzyme